MADRVFVLAPWIRVWHWLNAGLILCLIASGFSLHYSGTPVVLIGFDLARQLHNFCGLCLCANYAFFFIGNIVSGKWGKYVPRPQGFAGRCLKQMRYYGVGIFRGEPEPFPVTSEDYFNPLQQVTYWAVMYLLMPMLIGTGLFFLYPSLAPDHWFGVDGLLPIAVAHYLLGSALFLFLLSHLYLITLGKKLTSQIKMMITGWHEE